MLPAGQHAPVAVHWPSQQTPLQSTPAQAAVALGGTWVGTVFVLVGGADGTVGRWVGAVGGAPRRAASTSSSTIAPTAATLLIPSRAFSALRRLRSVASDRTSASNRRSSMNHPSALH